MADLRSSPDDAWRAQQDVSRRLMDLYAVGAGLALAIGVERMVRFADDSDAAIRWSSLPIFLALLATLIPFYHGALRHLHKRWVEDHSGMTRQSMMVDFLMLFLGVAVMFVMAYVVTQPRAFALAFLALLAIDCLWALTFDSLVGRRVRHEGLTEWVVALPVRAWRFIASSMRRSEHGSRSPRGTIKDDPAELNWLWLNLWALVVAIPILVALASTDLSLDSLGFSLAVMAFAVARTLLDYGVNGDFYFPGIESAKAKNGGRAQYS